MDRILYVTDTGNPFDGPATVYSINLAEPPQGSLPFAELAVDIVRVRTERPRLRIDGRFALSEESDGIDVLREDVTIWFGNFSQTLFSGFFVRNDSEENFEFKADSSGVTEMSIMDDGTFRLIARDIRVPTLGIDAPVRFSLNIGNDAGDTRNLLDEEGRFGLIE